MSSVDTIFALSSGKLPAGIAVVRITGARTRFALETIFGSVPEPRRARVGAFQSTSGEFDHGICLYFPGPGSVTGEDCGELHLHGGVAVVKTALTMLSGLPGLRMAEPGEFTQRAFLNGKIDLTGAEALADLIAAETVTQLELAGSAGKRQTETYERWRREILATRALLESALDFSDQEDVPDIEAVAISERNLEMAAELRQHAGRFRQADIVRTGFNVVIIGAPNVGKSSLLNALALRDIALVSDEPGTTRDAVSVSLDIGGYKVVLTDTAGLRDDPGRVEAMGIDRARLLARDADLVLRVTDSSNAVWVEIPDGPRRIEVGSKADIAGDVAGFDVVVSSVSNAGIDALLSLIGNEVRQVTRELGTVWPTRERHVLHLDAAALSLELAAEHRLSPELAAEEMRTAARELGRIVGVSDTEELLGEIFGRFCIGK
jgi:tRNA modification GTPase